MNRLGAIILCSGLASCAASESEVETQPMSKYRKSVYSTRTSSVYAYCYVEFSLLGLPASSPTFLETDTLVACNGVQAAISANGYYATFAHENAEQVRVTVVRPKTGATSVEYYPIQ